MASEKANFFKLGLTFVVGIAVLVATVVYLGKSSGNGHLLVAETYYLSPVSGLSVGSAVNFRGVKVGEVKDITFVGAAYPNVSADYAPAILVRMGLDERKFQINKTFHSPDAILHFLIDQGLRATVSLSGVTGLSHIELNLAKSPAAPQQITWTPDNICIPPGLSLLASVSDSASRILDQINTADFAQGWTNLLRVTKSSADALERLKTLPFDEISTNLVEATASGAAVMKHIEEVDFRGTVETVSTNATAAIAASRELVESAQRMVKDADQLVRDADALVAEQHGAVSRVLANLESASLQLKLLASDLRAHPGRLLRTEDSAPVPETQPQK